MAAWINLIKSPVGLPLHRTCTEKSGMVIPAVHPGLDTVSSVPCASAWDYCP